MSKVLLNAVVTVSLLGATAHGQGVSTIEKVIANKSILMRVAINQETVKCSRQGYTAPFLKVLIPELAEHTILNHRNLGESAPCIAAYACADGVEPATLIIEGQPSEVAQVNIVQKRILIRDHELRTCRVILEENINAVIRQTLFTHQRQHELGERDFADCLEVSK